MRVKSYLVVGWALVLASAAGTLAAEEQNPVPGAYQSIEVARFDIKEGVEKFSADWLLTMDDLLVKQLQSAKVFKEVLREGEQPLDATAPTLKVVGTVTEFKAGSRMKRYMIGFGAGKTVIKAHVRWLDKATGGVVFEDDVDGKVILGYAGGDSIGATSGLAHEVAKVTKKQFFRK
jgi:curli biogenesis system outer membrane secretion channel CsgG